MTLEAARPLIEQVDTLVSEGQTKKAAIAEVGLTDFGYWYWKNKIAGRRVSHDERRPKQKRSYRKRSKITVEHAPQAPQLMRIWGETSDKRMVLLSDLGAVA